MMFLPFLLLVIGGMCTRNKIHAGALFFQVFLSITCSSKAAFVI